MTPGTRAPSLALRAESLGLWAGILFCLGCGYHTAGHSSAIPQEVRTIAIPAFVNQTHTYKIEQMLTSAVVREMVTRTNYHVVSKVDDDADATLRGTVLSTYTTPLTYDSTTGRAATVLVVISMSVSLQEKNGKV
ncbi:MAG: LptE family protein, partial [Acidobacteriaceae bacterium]|nr:LptE family protein [Acidobacteriaceae bacterium]